MLYNLSGAYGLNKNYRQALEISEEVIAINPNFPGIQRGRHNYYGPWTKTYGMALMISVSGIRGILDRSNPRKFGPIYTAYGSWLRRNRSCGTRFSISEAV